MDYISRVLARKKNADLLGETEFLIRDAVHRPGAEGIDFTTHADTHRHRARRRSCDGSHLVFHGTAGVPTPLNSGKLCTLHAGFGTHPKIPPWS